MKRIDVCGVLLNAVSVDEAVTYACDPVHSPCRVFTPNAVMLEAAQSDPGLRELLNAASLSLPDGVGVLWAAKRQNTPLRERVAGIDFGEALLKRAADRATPVFLLGGKPGVAERAADRLTERFCGLCIVGTCDGYVSHASDAEQALLSRIRESDAEILLVCMGFPRQERWICRNLPRLPRVRVAAALGGALDVWAGNCRRAPVFLQKCGLEWAWRMAQDPQKLARLPGLLCFALFSRKNRQKSCTKCTQSAFVCRKV